MPEPYVAAIETHTGAVLFVGDLVYKVKKPVDVGFLDWTSRAARVRALEQELVLNRRLAPDVYFGTGVLPGAGRDAEPVLVMRRLPADRKLSALVRGGRDVDGVLRQLAHQLAAFHLACPSTDVAVAAAGGPETLRRWQRNHERLRPSFGRWVDGSVATALLDRAEAYLAGRGPLLDDRIAHGRARDGHGDLLAEDIFCLADGPRILDCLDFDEHLRAGDVLADVAFLAMDLERLGRADLGWRLLELHRAMTGDSWPTSLAHHHVAYRAQVRALVSCVRADQGDTSAAPRAAELLGMAARHERAGRVRLVLIGGPPGTGKSTVAAGLGPRVGAVVLRSDEVRKELAASGGAVSHPDPSGSVLYRREWTDRTYGELLRRAAALLAHGETVVLDATWTEEARRARARSVARRARAELVELRCVADVGTARRRAEERRRRGTDASEAGADVADAMASAFEPWPAATDISTMIPVAASVDAAVDALGLA